VEEAILTRRMIPKVAERRPEKEDIEALLAGAVRAPNHFLTQPWRFVVLTGDALDELGEAMAERVIQERQGDPELERRVQLEMQRPRRAPVILTLIYVPSDDERAIVVEDRYAVGAAMQNILLMAHARGLGAYLRTGPAAEYEGVKRHLGLKEGEEIAGFIYLGFPEDDRPLTERTDAAELTEWRGW
jgi:nitroreductase